MTKKPKVVWVGSTPITPITPKQRKNLHKLMEKRLEMRRKKNPEVRGKVVDYISHSIDDGTLCMNQNGNRPRRPRCTHRAVHLALSKIPGPEDET